MKKPCPSFCKKLLCASVASVLGLSASGVAKATTYKFIYEGAFTLLAQYGSPVKNTPSPYASFGYLNGWYGNRTPITGSITYNDVTGTGTMTINGFLFFGHAPAQIMQPYGVTLQNIGNGACTNNDPAQGCQPGNLILGNMLFNWNASNPDYPVSTVWDASGMLNAIAGSVSLGTVITAGAMPASDGTNFGSTKTPISLPLGPAPLATSTWNTTPNGCAPDCGGVNPSGMLPLVADTIGASPIIGTSFSGFNLNFDFTKLSVECIDATCLNTPPALDNKMPGPGATQVNSNADIIFTFTRKMKTPTVATAFTLKDSGGTTIPGTLIENSNTPGTASNYTFNPANPLVDTFTYTANVTTAALDENNVALGTAESWSFTVGAPPPPPSCTPVPQVPVGSNFTMLNPAGETFPEGTNDIAYSFTFDPDNIQAGDLNTSVSDTKFNMTFASLLPQTFFGFTLPAHHIRVFGPGTYTFDTTCTVTQIAAGISNCNNPLEPAQTQRFMTMTVGAGQLGAHMLLDWGQNQQSTSCGRASCNIDVVNVWDRNAVWKTNPLNLNPPPGSSVNRLYDGPAWGGPAGTTLNPNTTWKLVSTDPDGDGFNGVKMVDGPFNGYGANFNFGAADSCIAPDATPDPFVFMDQTGVALSTEIVSNPITVTGIDTPAGIGVFDGEYSINGGAYTSAFGTVNNGDVITVRHTSALTYSTTTNTILMIDILSDTFSSTTMAEPAPDADADGIADNVDNCTYVANPDQRDTDNDGYGNLCDADFNNSGFVNSTDLAIFKLLYGTDNVDADLNGSGFVNAADLAIFKSLYGKPPGPSGLVP